MNRKRQQHRVLKCIRKSRFETRDDDVNHAVRTRVKLTTGCKASSSYIDFTSSDICCIQLHFVILSFDNLKKVLIRSNWQVARYKCILYNTTKGTIISTNVEGKHRIAEAKATARYVHYQFSDSWLIRSKGETCTVATDRGEASEWIGDLRYMVAL